MTTFFLFLLFSCLLDFFVIIKGEYLQAFPLLTVVLIEGKEKRW